MRHFALQYGAVEKFEISNASLPWKFVFQQGMNDVPQVDRYQILCIVIECQFVAYSCIIKFYCHVNTSLGYIFVPDDHFPQILRKLTNFGLLDYFEGIYHWLGFYSRTKIST